MREITISQHVKLLAYVHVGGKAFRVSDVVLIIEQLNLHPTEYIAPTIRERNFLDTLMSMGIVKRQWSVAFQEVKYLLVNREDFEMLYDKIREIRKEAEKCQSF